MNNTKIKKVVNFEISLINKSLGGSGYEVKEDTITTGTCSK
jgi:hypothetical protein